MRLVKDNIEIMQQIDHKTKFNFYLWVLIYAPILIISTIAFFGLYFEGLPKNEDANLYNTMLIVLAIPMVSFVIYLIKKTFTTKEEVIINGKKDYPNGFHLIATFFTGGFWAIGWLLMYLKRDKTIYN